MGMNVANHYDVTKGAWNIKEVFLKPFVKAPASFKECPEQLVPRAYPEFHPNVFVPHILILAYRKPLLLAIVILLLCLLQIH